MKHLLLGTLLLATGCQTGDTNNGSFIGHYHDKDQFELPVYGNWSGPDGEITIEPGEVDSGCKRDAEIESWYFHFIEEHCEWPWVVPYRVTGGRLWIWIEGEKRTYYRTR